MGSLWSLSIARGTTARTYTVLADGCTHLSLVDGQAWLSGPRSRATQVAVEPGRRAFGVRFRPGGARPFLALAPALPLRDRTIPGADLEDLAWATCLAAAVASIDDEDGVMARLDRALRLVAERARPPDPLVARATAAISNTDPPPTVGALAAAAKLSARQFRRRFVAAVDLSPKELIGTWRVRRCALAILESAPDNWSDFSAQHHFADQSHLVREFRRLSGLAPRELARRLARVDQPGPWRP